MWWQIKAMLEATPQKLNIGAANGTCCSPPPSMRAPVRKMPLRIWTQSFRVGQGAKTLRGRFRNGLIGPWTESISCAQIESMKSVAEQVSCYSALRRNVLNTGRVILFRLLWRNCSNASWHQDRNYLR